MYLNTDDLYDSELALLKSRIVGGTMVLWATHLDPYVTISPTSTSSFTILVLQLPGYQTSVHVTLYLPTSGKDQEFVAELMDLQVCVEHLVDKYPKCALFIRGDSNVNIKNKYRSAIFSHFLDKFSLIKVPIQHTTYHHFLGNGLYDSEIDVLLHADLPGVGEQVVTVLCVQDNPQLLSHHDLILSECSVPPCPVLDVSHDSLVTAPRLQNNREKVTWSDEGADKYCSLVMPALQLLRESWLVPGSTVCMSVLLQLTSFVMTTAARLTNQVVTLGTRHNRKSMNTPRTIRIAKQRLGRAHKNMKKNKSEVSEKFYKMELKNYRKCVRLFRLQEQGKTEAKLLTILSDNPSSLYNYIRSCKTTSQTKIEKLTVQNKTYVGDRVPDGFYDAMTSLKTCDNSVLLAEPAIADQIDNYRLITNLSREPQPLPVITFEVALKLLRRLKKNVKDHYSITALHYFNAGDEGIAHFQAILNAMISDTDNATLEELNIAHGIILYKGHKKIKTDERSYRCISSCPFLSKAMDLYIRDLHQEKWNSCQASTQYQGAGSSHELASLLPTEVLQHSLHTAKKPVFLLALDAQSAFDRCLRQILICELFKAGMKDDALTLVDNRLASRSTVYEWDTELLGPAPDMTGFEQGAINSSDYYKLYNNQQLITAQSSALGVSMGSLVISAIGQADDVILCSNNIDSLRLLVTLTELYCTKYRVKLVPTKTRLLGYATTKQQHLLDHARLVNPITIDGQPVPFTSELEHVGVLRNTAGNMPNILNKIAEHKSGLQYVLSAGLARGQHGNPSASLRVHELYSSPRLFSGLASLVLTKSEIKLIDSYYQKTVMNLQRLHPKTPRCFVFLQAGCLPGEAILHKKQLTLFMMICHLKQNPLNIHARHVLVSGRFTAQSWFQQIRQICLLYGLDHPLKLLDTPPTKTSFKQHVKKMITSYWESVLREEASNLPSLQYFVAENASLRWQHPVWTTSAKSSHETRKATILSRMTSGRFRSEYLTRHWSGHSQGFCKADTCNEVIGDLEHLLLQCPALSSVRARLWNMFFEQSIKYPALLLFLQRLDKSPPKLKMQFILDPSAFPDIHEIWNLFGQPGIDHVYYLVRTYAYYIYREKQILLGYWTGDNLGRKLGKKSHSRKRAITYYKSNESNISHAGALLTTPAATGPVQDDALANASDGHGAGKDDRVDRPLQQPGPHASQPDKPALTAQGAPDNTDHAALPCHDGDLLDGRASHGYSGCGKFACVDCWPSLQRSKSLQGQQRLGSSAAIGLPGRGHAGAC